MVQSRKNLTWNVPFFGVGTIFIGVAAENIAMQEKKYTAFVKFTGGKTDFSTDEAENLGDSNRIIPAANDSTGEPECFTHQLENPAASGNRLAVEAKNSGVEPKRLGLQPKESGREIKIFTFGLFIVKIDSRIRAGFVKRHQILVEA